MYERHMSIHADIRETLKWLSKASVSELNEFREFTDHPNNFRLMGIGLLLERAKP